MVQYWGNQEADKHSNIDVQFWNGKVNSHSHRIQAFIAILGTLQPKTILYPLLAFPTCHSFGDPGRIFESFWNSWEVCVFANPWLVLAIYSRMKWCLRSICKSCIRHVNRQNATWFPYLHTTWMLIASAPRSIGLHSKNSCRVQWNPAREEAGWVRRWQGLPKVNHHWETQEKIVWGLCCGGFVKTSAWEVSLNVLSECSVLYNSLQLWVPLILPWPIFPCYSVY